MSARYFERLTVRPCSNFGRLASGSLLESILPQSLCRELRHRSDPEIAAEQLYRHQLRDSIRLSMQRLNIDVDKQAMVDITCRHLDEAAAKQVAKKSALGAVYAYEEGAELSFRAARARDIACIYDLPFGYWRHYRRLIAEEAELQPE